MKMLRAFFIYIILFSAFSLHAGQKPLTPQIDVDFDSESVYAGQPFQVQISVTAQGEGDPQVSIPQMKGIDVIDKSVSRPSSSYSMSWSFGTGQNARQVVKKQGTWVYTLILKSREAGKRTIGPISVKIDGYTFKGRIYPFNVLEPGAQLEVADDAQDSVAQEVGGNSNEVLENVRIDPDYFIHMIPSKKEVVVGELIILDVYLYTSVGNLSVNQFDKEPGTDGFWVERFEDDDLRNIQNKRVTINGVLYERVLLKRLAMFPLKSGELVIAPPILNFTAGSAGMGFFSMGRGKIVKRAAQPVTIKVNPLPDVDKPAGFNDSNIGNFNFFMDVSSKSVKTGEPVTVTFSVKGKGNIRNVVLPSLEEIDGVKMYPPENDSEVRVRGGGVSGMKQSKVLLIPNSEGSFTIPEVGWSYFNPATGKYETNTVKPVKVTVEKGTSSFAGGKVAVIKGGNNTNSSALSRVNSEMKTIRNEIDVTLKTPSVLSRWWFLGTLFGLPFLYLGFLFYRFNKKRSTQLYEKNRSKRAKSSALKSLDSLSGKNEDKGSSAYSDLQKILTTYLEDKLDAPVAGDTMPELNERLGTRGISQELTGMIISFIEECEFARFAKSSQAENRVGDEIAALKDIINGVESATIVPVVKKRRGAI
ncbi:MAG: protein BatD [Deltaproteobacteria bacterium]|nr:protein BatD [Deltaproteobacteria bacterium]